MTDATQILLVAAITVMTVILTILGIQFFFVLKDLRMLLTKVNSVIEEFEHVGMGVRDSFSEMSILVSSLKKLYFLVDLLSKKKKHKKDDEK